MSAAAKLSSNQKDMVVDSLVALAQSLNAPAGGVKKTAAVSAADKEIIVSQMLQDPTGRGMKRIA